MRCFWRRLSLISLNARVSSPTSSRDAGATRAESSPAASAFTAMRSRCSGRVMRPLVAKAIHSPSSKSRREAKRT